MDIEERLQRWGSEHRQRAASGMVDPLAVIEEGSLRRGNRRAVRLLAPAGAAVVVAVLAVVVLTIGRSGDPSSRAGVAARPKPSSSAMSLGPSLNRCGHVPKNAAAANFRAVLVADIANQSWRVTITNQTQRRVLLDLNRVVVVAYAPDRNLIASSVIFFSISVKYLSPGASITLQVLPGKTHPCTDVKSPLLPGRYNFVATFSLGKLEFSSNTVVLDIGAGGVLRPHRS